MARKDRKSAQEERLERVRRRLEGACHRLYGSLLGPLLRHVYVVECADSPQEPVLACVETTLGLIRLNPYRRQELDEAEWTFILAHQLLHLGLNHAVRRLDRDPFRWNIACEHAIDNLLHAFKIGHPPHDFGIDTSFAGMREEEIYDLLSNDRRATTIFRTYAGPNRPDMIAGSSVEPRDRLLRSPNLDYYHGQSQRRDYEKLLAEGIRNAVDKAVLEAAKTMGQEGEQSRVWWPVENARRWVMNELPLLGALAAQFRVITDGEICDRMDIPIAAIDAYLGEIYFHPKWDFTQAEVLFIYVHELLHAALLHHSRLDGRDPWVWNLATDFVINGWLVEMGVGQIPRVGVLYDPRLAGMSSEEVYDLLVRDPRRCKGLRGFRGGLTDILWDSPGRRIYRGDVTTLDDMIRRCMAAGLACPGRGMIPAGLLEEVQSLFTPPVPWDVELARWMEAHVPMIRDPLRTYARASRRQASTPDIPRPARYVPQEWKDACTFGVVMDTSGSMDRELLGRALGAIASYAEARDVPTVRLVLCDAAPYDRGIVAPTDLRGVYPVIGRGGTILQPAVSFLLSRADFPSVAPVMILTDGWCEEEILCPRDHCFVLPRKQWKEGALPLRTSAPVFRVLKEEYYEEKPDPPTRVKRRR